jgi:hypothetical protein
LPKHSAKVLTRQLGHSNIEFLPIDIDGEQWCLLNPLRQLSLLEDSSSDVEGYELEGQKLLSWVNWINVKYEDPNSSVLFTLKGMRQNQLFISNHMKEVLDSLKLVGLIFKHIGYLISDPADAVPPPPKPIPKPLTSSKPLTPPKLVELKVSEREALEKAGVSLLQRLNIGIGATDQELLRALSGEIERLRPGFEQLPAETRYEIAMALSYPYGELLRLRQGWRWAGIKRAGLGTFFGVVSPDDTHAMYLASFMSRQLLAEETAPVLELTFNMIKSGTLAESAPGVLLAIT